jgi:hypothetical protein
VRTHGVFRTIVVASDSVILAGNHTYMAALAEKESQLWISRVPFPHTDKQAIQIMLIDNEGADRAQNDDGQLAAILQQLDAEDLPGAGFDEHRLKSLLSKLQQDTSQQLGAVEYRLMIVCESEQHQAELLERLQGEGLKVQAQAT